MDFFLNMPCSVCRPYVIRGVNGKFIIFKTSITWLIFLIFIHNTILFYIYMYFYLTVKPAGDVSLQLSPPDGAGVQLSEGAGQSERGTNCGVGSIQRGNGM